MYTLTILGDAIMTLRIVVEITLSYSSSTIIALTVVRYMTICPFSKAIASQGLTEFVSVQYHSWY